MTETHTATDTKPVKAALDKPLSAELESGNLDPEVRAIIAEDDDLLDPQLRKHKEVLNQLSRMTFEDFDNDALDEKGEQFGLDEQGGEAEFQELMKEHVPEVNGMSRLQGLQYVVQAGQSGWSKKSNRGRPAEAQYSHVEPHMFLTHTDNTTATYNSHIKSWLLFKLQMGLKLDEKVTTKTFRTYQAHLLMYEFQAADKMISRALETEIASRTLTDYFVYKETKKLIKRTKKFTDQYPFAKADPICNTDLKKLPTDTNAANCLRTKAKALVQLGVRMATALRIRPEDFSVDHEAECVEVHLVSDKVFGIKGRKLSLPCACAPGILTEYCLFHNERLRGAFPITPNQALKMKSILRKGFHAFRRTAVMGIRAAERELRGSIEVCVNKMKEFFGWSDLSKQHLSYAQDANRYCCSDLVMPLTAINYCTRFVNGTKIAKFNA